MRTITFIVEQPPGTTVDLDSTPIITVTREDTGAALATAAAMIHASIGVYTYSLAEPAPGLVYDYTISWTYSGVSGSSQGVSSGAASGASGVGVHPISQDTGGTDVLRYVTAQGVGIGGASVLIYLAGDYPDNPGNVQVNATTDEDGRWGPLYVASGTYVAVFCKQGVSGPDVSVPFTV